ncbi:kelch repeat protein [Gigaspora margarita]|uniref:Kelch repeat protein n=1 Tax=Gigaspora margarita TaxID=4874 RepID=A0A8H4B1C2_GIGMA|nr:kelch repeat protein [Gigaspora margarita]
MSTFAPTSRYFQSSVVVGERIYFLGGVGATGKGTSDFFYLNVSPPFNTVNLQWTDLTSVAPIPVLSAFSPSCVGGSSNSTIFLFEHRSTNNVNSTTLVTFSLDINSPKWSNTITSGVTPPVRQEMSAVVDKNGKIYINGGYYPYEPSTMQKSYNNTYIFDSLKLSWTSGSNAPIVRSDCTATLLPSGLIVYIGGTNDDSLTSPEVDMTRITTYNTITGTWLSVTAVGDVITARQSHSAVLGKDGTIIIYGGGYKNLTVAPTPALATLDTSTTPYKWSAKQTSGTYTAPPLAFHSAEMVGNYMILAFGSSFSGTKFDIATAPNNNIYLLDTTTYTWVSSFDKNSPPNNIPNPSGSSPSSPKSTSTSNASSPNNNPLNIPLIAGIGGVLVAFVIVASIVGFIFYRKYRKYRPDDEPYIATPGTGDRDREYNREYNDNIDYIATPGTDLRESRYTNSTHTSVTNQYGTPSPTRISSPGSSMNQYAAYPPSNTSSIYHTDVTNLMHQPNRSSASGTTFLHPGTPVPGTGAMYNQGAYTQGGPTHIVYAQGGPTHNIYTQGGATHDVYTQGVLTQVGPTHGNHGLLAQNVTDEVPTAGTRSVYSNTS